MYINYIVRSRVAEVMGTPCPKTLRPHQNCKITVLMGLVFRNNYKFSEGGAHHFCDPTSAA